MPELSAQIADQVVAACRAGAAEAAEAFGRALDARLTLSVGEPGTIGPGSIPEPLREAGLAVVLSVGAAGALVLIPEAGGLLPDWCAHPDPTGQSKLSTLAQELGMTLLPEPLMPEEFKAGRVKNLAGAAGRGGLDEGAAAVPLELADDQGKRTGAMLVFPVRNPSAVLGAAAEKPAGMPKTSPSEPAPDQPATPPPAATAKTGGTPPQADGTGPARAKSPRDLPTYARSLLRIRVPVVVTLAQKRQPLGRIVELGPGSIIQFDKSCEEMLGLSVGGLPIAQGEAVKVGDKFGLRVTSITLPEERFQPVGPPTAQAAAVAARGPAAGTGG